MDGTPAAGETSGERLFRSWSSPVRAFVPSGMGYVDCRVPCWTPDPDEQAELAALVDEALAGPELRRERPLSSGSGYGGFMFSNPHADWARTVDRGALHPWWAEPVSPVPETPAAALPRFYVREGLLHFSDVEHMQPHRTVADASSAIEALLVRSAIEHGEAEWLAFHRAGEAPHLTPEVRRAVAAVPLTLAR